MTEIQALWMFHTGRAPQPRGRIEAGVGSERCWMPILCFLIVHPDELVLVDTGLGERTANFVTRGWGRLLAGVMGFSFAPGLDCRSQLAACGIDPSHVGRGVLTHMHWDHVGGLEDLDHVRFAVARRELEAVRSVQGLRAVTRGYMPSLGARVDRLEPIDFGAAEDLEPFDAAHDLLGDGSIRLLPTPGHSPGHTSLLLRASGGREVLLAGDAAFTQGQIVGDLDLGWMPRRFAADLNAARETLNALRAFVRRRPGIRVFTSHDPDQGDDATSAPVNVLED